MARGAVGADRFELYALRRLKICLRRRPRIGKPNVVGAGPLLGLGEVREQRNKSLNAVTRAESATRAPYSGLVKFEISEMSVRTP